MRTSYFAHAILWYVDFMTLLRLGLLSLLVVTGCKQELTPEQRWRARQREALAQVTPRNVSVELSADGRMMEGKAATFDDVSELMRGLNNIVSSREGLGRVVERARDGGVRVELLDGGELVEAGRGVDFFFSGFELTSTQTVDGGVHFTLKFGVKP